MHAAAAEGSSSHTLCLTYYLWPGFSEQQSSCSFPTPSSPTRSSFHMVCIMPHTLLKPPMALHLACSAKRFSLSQRAFYAAVTCRFQETLHFTFPGKRNKNNPVAKFLSGDSDPAEKRRIQSQPLGNSLSRLWIIQGQDGFRLHRSL